MRGLCGDSCKHQTKRRVAANLHAVLVHVSKTATVEIEHPDAAAHSHKVIAAVQTSQVDNNGAKSPLHLWMTSWSLDVDILGHCIHQFYSTHKANNVLLVGWLTPNWEMSSIILFF